MVLTAVPQGDFDGAKPLFERTIKFSKKVSDWTIPTFPRPSSTSLESLNQLQPGTPVLLHDLQSRQDLNGRSASILKFDESKKRYHVTIDQSNQKSITVKPPNLLQRVQGVQVDTTTGETVLYAGSIVGARLENTTRLFSVQGSGESTWAPEEQLRFPPGTLVTITGVGRKPELNGTGGTIESWDSEARRYVIRRSASERIELRSNNVTLALGDAN